ncbi:hypothetical protein N9564_01865 [Amylibacter sp.]|jgi:hypothetical protein|nr:hypothetical protein [Amylibacter sp.]
MRRDIIRIHQHSSEIVLAKCVSRDYTFYQKSSYSPEGIREIKNEYAGYHWYLERAYPNLSASLNNEKDGYANITIPNFEAWPCDQPTVIDKAYKYALRAINCYKNIWLKSSNKHNLLYPIHGDFSLEGNILFSRSDVYIIDWEHFHLKIAPLGFDILFMVFELLKLEFKNTCPTKKKLFLAKKLINYAVSIGVISSSYQNNYFSSFLAKQDDIKFVWKNQYHKLPTTQFTALQTQILTDYFK